MFAKSKRFPSIGKDYIPGPGEYDVNVDDSSRHKRYGFLSQSDRFTEDHAEDDGYSTSTLSSEIVPKKSMQKEHETLINKLKRMEFTVQALENEKKSIQLTKDMELADVRSKNASFQKTVNRLEKLLKASTWQRRIEQIESNYKKKLVEKEHQIIKLQQCLESKTTETDIIQHRHQSQIEELLNALRDHDEQMNILHKELSQREHKIKEYEQLYAEQKIRISSDQQELVKLRDQLKDSDDIRKELTKRLESQELNLIEQHQKIEEQATLIVGLQKQFKLYRQYITRPRETQCTTHIKDLNQLLSELNEAKKFINQQAILMDSLKSSIYWLNSRCRQAEQSLLDMRHDRLQQTQFYQFFFQQTFASIKCQETEHLEIKVNNHN
ncbi:hypothetical protein RO3G_06971 [Rhizopus delemar RA 99-880]|uniref:Uncharacterized protein n=1 Tax=Rhizopus delemar (strain RA 99-880 / ATCC MYA-4621 / FGSC 9543 / NRRL 43880) TaxID=246409 RepID=I1C1D6_RHIO9|nr:hypothetical protein RO3G_06971 [Rhizopus delemar RA 99-880]|eukprot:EIE82266.1 hypothetical protein RO3G_06971 [Rhizopus delemar RA 99-880]